MSQASARAPGGDRRVVNRSGAAAAVWRWVVRLVTGALVMALILLGGTALRVWQVARIDDFTKADAIVVLGAAQYAGTPSSVFEARLDRARKLYQAGIAPLVITVGGKQPGDQYTEAAAGKAYLQDNGVPADKILAVEVGSDTLRSIDAVSAAMHTRKLSTVVLVSDPWHSLRARAMARDAGLDAWTAPTRQGPAVFTRESQVHGITRETGALLWYHLTHFPADFRYTAGQ